MDLASCKEVVLLRLPITEPPSDGGCAQVWEGSVGGAGLVWFKEVALLRLQIALLLLMAGSPLHRLPALPT